MLTDSKLKEEAVMRGRLSGDLKIFISRHSLFGLFIAFQVAWAGPVLAGGLYLNEFGAPQRLGNCPSPS